MLRTALAGLAALAAAMGIGRFAFTPLLPLMQETDGLSLAQGGYLASANYIGYFAGALLATRVRPGLLPSLAAIAVTTLAMGMVHGMAAWLVLRFAAGVASAWALVQVSAWALPRLNARMADLSECLRYEDAARLRDRIASLERVIARLRRLDELRRLRLRLVVPGAEAGSCEEFFLSNGRVHRDLIAACAPGTSFEADHLDELVVVGSFLERPPPELRVRPLP